MDSGCAGVVAERRGNCWKSVPTLEPHTTQRIRSCNWSASTDLAHSTGGWRMLVEAASRSFAVLKPDSNVTKPRSSQPLPSLTGTAKQKASRQTQTPEEKTIYGRASLNYSDGESCRPCNPFIKSCKSPVSNLLFVATAVSRVDPQELGRRLSTPRVASRTSSSRAGGGNISPPGRRRGIGGGSIDRAAST